MDARLKKALDQIPYFNLGQVDTEVDAVLERLGYERSIHADCVEFVINRRKRRAEEKAKRISEEDKEADEKELNDKFHDSVLGLIPLMEDEEGKETKT